MGIPERRIRHPDEDPNEELAGEWLSIHFVTRSDLRSRARQLTPRSRCRRTPPPSAAGGAAAARREQVLARHALARAAAQCSVLPWRWMFSRSQSSSGANSPRANWASRSPRSCPRLLEELGGVQVAERVRREVADRAAGPVDVLEAAAGVVGRGEAEVLLHPLVPRAGQVGGRQVAARASPARARSGAGCAGCRSPRRTRCG